MILIIRNGRLFPSVKSVGKHLNVKRSTIVSFLMGCIRDPDAVENWRILRGEDAKDLDKISQAIYCTSANDIERFRKSLNALKDFQPKSIKDRDSALEKYAKYAKALGQLERDVEAGEKFVKNIGLAKFRQKCCY